MLRHPGAAGSRVLSHRGDRLAMLDFSDEGSTLWIVDLSAGTEGRLTRSDQQFYGSAWTPDDSRVVSNTTEAGKRVLMAIDTRSGTQRNVNDHGLVVRAHVDRPRRHALLDTLVSGRLNDIIYLPHGEGTETYELLGNPRE